MPNSAKSNRFVTTHVAEVPPRRPLLGPRMAKRLPVRRIRASRLELGTVEGRAGIALRILQDDGESQCELHPDLGLAVGQAELEFGVSPSAWTPVGATASRQRNVPR